MHSCHWWRAESEAAHSGVRRGWGRGLLQEERGAVARGRPKELFRMERPEQLFVDTWVLQRGVFGKKILAR